MLLPDGFPGWNRAYDQGNAVLNNPEDKLLLDDYFREDKKGETNEIPHGIYSHADEALVLCVDDVFCAQQLSSEDEPNNTGDDTPVACALVHAYNYRYM
jgi:hypothetical protein